HPAQRSSQVLRVPARHVPEKNPRQSPYRLVQDNRIARQEMWSFRNGSLRISLLAARSRPPLLPVLSRTPRSPGSLPFLFETEQERPHQREGWMKASFPNNSVMY